MTYRLVIQPTAAADIEQAYQRIVSQAPETAKRWLDGLIDAVESLTTLPERCSIAPESNHFEREIRQLLYGRKGRTYRALFTIVEDKVHVLHFRHWAQRTMPAAEIRGPE